MKNLNFYPFVTLNVTVRHKMAGRVTQPNFLAKNKYSIPFLLVTGGHTNSKLFFIPGTSHPSIKAKFSASLKSIAG